MESVFDTPLLRKMEQAVGTDTPLRLVRMSGENTVSPFDENSEVLSKTISELTLNDFSNEATLIQPLSTDHRTTIKWLLVYWLKFKGIDITTAGQTITSEDAFFLRPPLNITVQELESTDRSYSRALVSQEAEFNTINESKTALLEEIESVREEIDDIEVEEPIIESSVFIQDVVEGQIIDILDVFNAIIVSERIPFCRVTLKNHKTFYKLWDGYLPPEDWLELPIEDQDHIHIKIRSHDMRSNKWLYFDVLVYSTRIEYRYDVVDTNEYTRDGVVNAFMQSLDGLSLNDILREGRESGMKLTFSLYSDKKFDENIFAYLVCNHSSLAGIGAGLNDICFLKEMLRNRPTQERDGEEYKTFTTKSGQSIFISEWWRVLEDTETRKATITQYLDNDASMIRLRLYDITNLEEFERYKTILVYVFGLYNRYYDAIVEIYNSYSYTHKFKPSKGATKVEFSDKRSKPLKKILESHDPLLFGTGYSNACHRKPTLHQPGSEEELKAIFEDLYSQGIGGVATIPYGGEEIEIELTETIKKSSDKTLKKKKTERALIAEIRGLDPDISDADLKKRVPARNFANNCVMVYGDENFVYTCIDPSSWSERNAFPYMVHNDRNPAYPCAPCCAKTPRKKEPTATGCLGKEIVSTHVSTKGTPLGEGRLGTLPENTSKFLRSPSDSVFIYREGMIGDNKSFFRCMERFMENHRDEVIDIGNLVSDIRENDPLHAVAMQSMVDCNCIESFRRSPNSYRVDPQYWVSMMEVLTQSRIILIDVTDPTDDDFLLPHYIDGYIPPLTEYTTTMIVCVHNPGTEDVLCELVGQFTDDQNPISYDFEEYSSFARLYEKSSRTYIVEPNGIHEV